MTTAQVMSPWTTSTGPAGPCNVPKISVDYPLSLCEQQDGNNPPTPCLVEITCTDDVWTAIQADPTYTVV